MTSITSEEFLRWNESIIHLIGSDNVERFPESLVYAIEGLTHLDNGLIVFYGKNTKPVNIYDNAEESLRYQNIDAYFEGAYLLDPYYRAGLEGIETGLYHLSDISPPGFYNSEYYKRFFRSSMISDEVGFIVHLEENCFANVSLVNLFGSPAFSKTEINRLRLALPVVRDILEKYRGHQKEQVGEDAPQLHSQLEAALSVFGSSVLTRRECEIVRMYLHGHSTKSIAERLFISDHTVSLHRKNLYAKLKVSSQAELFHLFIESLSCVDKELKYDPLELYLHNKALP